MIQVLELHDDTHSPCYVTHGSYYSNADRFIKEIAKAHTCNYEIREVRLCNNYEGISDEKLERYFSRLDSCYDIEALARDNFEAWKKRDETFEMLWEVAEEI